MTLNDLKIVLQEDASGKEQEYYEKWKYGFVGVSDEDELNELIESNAFNYLFDYMWNDDYFENFDYYAELANQQAKEQIENELKELQNLLGYTPLENTDSNPDADTQENQAKSEADIEETPKEESDEESSDDSVNEDQQTHNENVIDNEGESYDY